MPDYSAFVPSRDKAVSFAEGALAEAERERDKLRDEVRELRAIQRDVADELDELSQHAGCDWPYTFRDLIKLAAKLRGEAR